MSFAPSLAVCVLLFLALLALVWMSLIDLKIRILPDELVGLLAVCGVLFHLASGFAYLDWLGMAVGVLAGGGTLWIIRFVANKTYGFETMGLGDVKLMAAAGIWLGGQGALVALSLGAVCGLVHGIAFMAYRRTKGQKLAFRSLTIPAGPGFAAGAALVAAWQLRHLPVFAL